MPIQWSLLLFSLFVGLGMGAFGFVALAELTGQMEKLKMPGAITALVGVVVGGLFSFFHLGHPERIFHVLGNLGSGIAQELIVTSIAGAVIVGYILLLKWDRAAKGMKNTAAVLGLILAVVVPFSTGKIYVLPARPAWNTWILPIMFVASAAILGMLTMYIWALIKEEDGAVLAKISKMTLYAQVFFSVMVVAYVGYISMAPHQHENRAVSRMLTGDLALAFWVAVVAIGILIPLFLIFKNMVGKGSSGVTSGGSQVAAASATETSLAVPALVLACVLVGSVAIRIIMYLMGSSVHQYFGF